MKRLISSIQGGIAEQALKEIYKKYNNPSKLYIDYRDYDFGENFLVTDETMRDWYENYINNIDNDYMSFYEWEQEALKNGDLEEFTAEWIEDYILNEDSELIKRDFPIIYKHIR